MKVLFEDNHIIVAEKPAGMLSQGDITNSIDMLSTVKDYVKKKYNKPGEVYIGLLHRLDRPVGGVMVFARTSKAASRISEQIRKREFKKTYIAVLDGIIDNDEGSFTDYLLKNNKENIVKVVSKDTPNAQIAKLNYKVLDRCKDKTLVRIELETGRPHQIRVQFSNAGHYIIGDNKYGVAKPKSNIALWSNRIEFVHPTKKEKVVFESNPPKDKYPWSEFI